MEKPIVDVSRLFYGRMKRSLFPKHRWFFFNPSIAQERDGRRERE